ncbi:MAG: sodium:solute symporter family transporter [Phycisphaerae bacterium]
MLGVRLAIDKPDLIIIIVYFVVIIGIGCLAGLYRRRASEGKNYFLAGGTLTWPIIGLALFSTNISTIHLVSQAQVGYLSGLAYGSFEWMAPFTLICLALFFAPFYLRSGVTTLPDFLEKRYSRASRNWLALLSIISAIFIHIGFSLYTGALVLNKMFGIDTMQSVVAISLLTGLYTIIGGLLAVVLTESLQTIILLCGAIAITAIGLTKAGGWNGMASSVDPVYLNVMRTAEQLPELPWYAVLLGYPVIGLWYWCADQTIVQRVLGAKNENHARVGPLFAGFIKILPVFIFVMPGTIGLALIHQGKMPSLPVAAAQEESGEASRPLTTAEQRVYDHLTKISAGPDKAVSREHLSEAVALTKAEIDGAVAGLTELKLARDKSEDIYAHMIQHLLPTGLKGIVAAALLAALMSTVSGALNSIATLFCYDIYRQWRPEVSDHKLVTLGRVVTFVAMVLSILWTPHIARFENIYKGANSLICYIAPPVTVVFLWGVFWRRASAKGAFATLVIGSVLGLMVFLLDWFKAYTGWSVNFMMAAFYLFVVCSVVLVAVSLLRPQPADHPGHALVWNHPLEALHGETWRGIGNYKFLAGLLFVTMVALYIIFR